MKFEILYNSQHISPNFCTGRLSMNDCEIKLLVRRISAASKNGLKLHVASYLSSDYTSNCFIKIFLLCAD